MSDPLDDLANMAAIRNLDVDDLVVVSRAIEFARNLQERPTLPIRSSDWELHWTGGAPPHLSKGSGDWWLVAVNASGGCLWARRKTSP